MVLEAGSVASLAKLVTHQERMQEDTLLPRILSAAFVLRTLQVILSSGGAHCTMGSPNRELRP